MPLDSGTWRGERFAAAAAQVVDDGNGFLRQSLVVGGLDEAPSEMHRRVDFDIDDVDAGIAELVRIHREADTN